MKSKALIFSLFFGILISPSVLYANGFFEWSYQDVTIQTTTSLNSDETDFVYGMIGLFETFEAAELKLDSFELDTSSTYQDLLIFLDDNLVDTARVDSLGVIIEDAVSNLSNSITDERFAGLIFIANDMHYEGISSIPDYMSLNNYSDIEDLGNHLLTFEMPSGDSSPICNNLFLESVRAILLKYASFNGKRGVSRPTGFAIGSALGIYVAALEQCNCLCTRYGIVPDGCKSCL